MKITSHSLYETSRINFSSRAIFSKWCSNEYAIALLVCSNFAWFLACSHSAWPLASIHLFHDAFDSICIVTGSSKETALSKVEKIKMQQKRVELQSLICKEKNRFCSLSSSKYICYTSFWDFESLFSVVNASISFQVYNFGSKVANRLLFYVQSSSFFFFFSIC